VNRYMGFSKAPDAGSGPEDLFLILDASGSMKARDFKPNRLRGAAEAGRALIEQKRRSDPNDRVGVISFDDEARVAHQLVEVGRGADSLGRALDGLKAGSATDISAGLRAAEENLLGNTLRDRLGFLQPIVEFFLDGKGTASAATEVRKPMRCILLSDGRHVTGPNPVPVAKSMKQRGITIDVIGISGSHDAKGLDEAQLKQIASRDQNGEPRYCFIGDTEQLVRKFEELAQHIRLL